MRMSITAGPVSADPCRALWPYSSTAGGLTQGTVPDLLCSVLSSVTRGSSHSLISWRTQTCLRTDQPNTPAPDHTSCPGTLPGSKQTPPHQHDSYPKQTGHACWPREGVGFCSLLLEGQNSCHQCSQEVNKGSSNPQKVFPHLSSTNEMDTWSVGQDSSVTQVHRQGRAPS